MLETLDHTIRIGSTPTILSLLCLRSTLRLYIYIYTCLLRACGKLVMRLCFDDLRVAVKITLHVCFCARLRNQRWCLLRPSSNALILGMEEVASQKTWQFFSLIFGTSFFSCDTMWQMPLLSAKNTWPWSWLSDTDTDTLYCKLQTLLICNI